MKSAGGRWSPRTIWPGGIYYKISTLPRIHEGNIYGISTTIVVPFMPRMVRYKPAGSKAVAGTAGGSGAGSITRAPDQSPDSTSSPMMSRNIWATAAPAMPDVRRDVTAWVVVRGN